MVSREKVCLACGRSFSWRKRWERVWGEVRYCSDGRRRGVSLASAERYEAAILVLLGRRAPDASICPSEVARALGKPLHAALDSVRAAAHRLAARGGVRITQGDRELSLGEVPRGAIRLRRGPCFPT